MRASGRMSGIPEVPVGRGGSGEGDGRQLLAGIGEEGGSAVEFALVAPLLIALLFGIAQIGLIVMYRTAVIDAARDVARAVSLGRLDVVAARTSLGAELDRILPPRTVDRVDGPPRTHEIVVEGDAVVIEIAAPYRDLLWSPALGDHLGAMRVTVRALKP